MTALGEEKLLEYYLQLYFYELKHREAINAGLTHSTTVLALLGVALVFLLEHPVPNAVAAQHQVWIILVWAGTIPLVGGIVATAMAWWGFRYQFATDPQTTEEWRKGMTDRGFDEESLAHHLFAEVLFQVAAVTSHNRARNKSKSRRAAAGRLSILLAALCYGMSLIPWTLSR